MHALRIEDATVGEEVIVVKPGFAIHDKIGKIWKVSVRRDQVRVSVSFEGEIYNFSLDELTLA